MCSYVFSSDFLKYRDNKVYLLNKHDLELKEYYEETYFIDFNEINTKKNIKVGDTELEYEILFYENDKNLLIKFDILNNSNDEDINRLIYSIEQNISGYDVDTIFKNVDFDILKKYSNYIKI